MRKIKKKVIVVFACMAVGCAGCTVHERDAKETVTYPEITEKIESSEDKWKDIPERIQRKQDNLTIDARVSVPKAFSEGAGTVYEGEKVVFLEEDVKGFLYEDEDVTQEDNLELSDTVTGNYTEQYYEFGNGASINFGGPYLGYVTPLAINLANCIRDNETVPSEYNMTLYQGLEDVELVSRQEAEEAVAALFERLNIEVSQNYECYVLDKDVLREQERAVDVDGNVVERWKKDQWTAKDEGYYFKFHQEIEGARLENIQNLGEGTMMNVIYGTEGFVDIYLANVYRVLGEKSYEPLLTPEEMADVMEEDYSMLIEAAPLEVREMTLAYCPVIVGAGELELRPVWKLDCTQTDETIGEWDQELLYDAVTGKEML